MPWPTRISRSEPSVQKSAAVAPTLPDGDKGQFFVATINNASLDDNGCKKSVFNAEVAVLGSREGKRRHQRGIALCRQKTRASRRCCAPRNFTITQSCVRDAVLASASEAADLHAATFWMELPIQPDAQVYALGRRRVGPFPEN